MISKSVLLNWIKPCSGPVCFGMFSFILKVHKNKGVIKMTSTAIVSQKESLRDKLGKQLQNNKPAIFGAILFVFFIDRAVADLRGLGIPLALLLIWGLSWLKRAGWSDVGIFKPQSWIKTILIGVGTAILFQSFAILQIRLGGPTPDLSNFEPLKNNIWLLLGMLVISWTSAGFGEEVIWRGFFMKQIAKFFGETKSGWWIGLLVSSVVFGLIHSYQGTTGIIMTGINGLVFGLIMLLSRRNLWTSIIAHAATDTFGFILIYNWDSISQLLGM
jgi:membrane protease YdiL (CAAX protease family)